MQRMKSYFPAISAFLIVLLTTLFILMGKNQTAPQADYATTKDIAKAEHNTKIDRTAQIGSNTKRQGQDRNLAKNTELDHSKKSGEISDLKKKGNKPVQAIPGKLTEDEIKAKIRAGEPGYEIFASRLTQSTVKIEPKWRKGDDFIVETYYYQMQAPGEIWSGPALWRFRIENEVSFRGEKCWQFIVTRIDDPKLSPSTFYVTRDTYQLAGMETTIIQKSKKRKMVYVPKASERSAAIEAHLSIVPFDIPAYRSEAKVIPAGLNKTPKFLARKAKMPKDNEILGFTGETYKVNYKTPFDRTRVRQTWSSTDMRWPVESRTESTWSFRRAKK
jgi:hypothetical protein